MHWGHAAAVVDHEGLDRLSPITGGRVVGAGRLSDEHGGEEAERLVGDTLEIGDWEISAVHEAGAGVVDAPELDDAGAALHDEAVHACIGEAGLADERRYSALAIEGRAIRRYALGDGRADVVLARDDEGAAVVALVPRIDVTGVVVDVEMSGVGEEGIRFGNSTSFVCMTRTSQNPKVRMVPA